MKENLRQVEKVRQVLKNLRQVKRVRQVLKNLTQMRKSKVDTDIEGDVEQVCIAVIDEEESCDTNQDAESSEKEMHQNPYRDICIVRAFLLSAINSNI